MTPLQVHSPQNLTHYLSLLHFQNVGIVKTGPTLVSCDFCKCRAGPARQHI